MNELDLVRQKIRKLMNDIADDLALGAAKDYSQYTHMTGQIAALAMIESEVIDIQKRSLEDGDTE